MIYMLSGNKSDMESMREVNFTEAKSFAEHNSMIDHHETSAKDNVNVDETFVKLAKVSCFTFYIGELRL